MVDHCAASRKTNGHHAISFFEKHNQKFQPVHKIWMALQHHKIGIFIRKCFCQQHMPSCKFDKTRNILITKPNTKPQAQYQSSSHQGNSQHGIQPTQPFPDLQFFWRNYISAITPVEEELTLSHWYITCNFSVQPWNQNIPVEHNYYALKLMHVREYNAALILAKQHAPLQSTKLRITLRTTRGLLFVPHDNVLAGSGFIQLPRGCTKPCQSAT